MEGMGKMSMTCCPLSANDGPNAKVFKKSRVSARKDTTCCECRDPIARGTVHEVIRGLWEQSWSTYRTCLICVEIRDHFECEGWLFEHVWDDLQENFFPDMKAGGPCMEGLSPDAKARLFDRRMAWLMGSGTQ
jgi:hypothetical protein